MAFKGNPRDVGAGRKKGTPNKSTQTLMEKCEALGCDPFEILIRFALGGVGLDLDEPVSNDLRQKSAKDAAEYLYPKRKAVELSADEDKGFRIIIDEYKSK